ncbi:hypothetical protein B0T16DRAFT_10766 [Cercophora newfieldiana]|uniref:Uncharacterized protein n=1 Tax=Cercophora newfieldiana TaxID=92897 RepID=A0AA39YPJ6_9PEZI|nr:hypothetical protein B0T16DRAFT_10766 [Cercophora newfieldiana]
MRKTTASLRTATSNTTGTMLPGRQDASAAKETVSTRRLLPSAQRSRWLPTQRFNSTDHGERTAQGCEPLPDDWRSTPTTRHLQWQRPLQHPFDDLELSRGVLARVPQLSSRHLVVGVRQQRSRCAKGWSVLAVEKRNGDVLQGTVEAVVCANFGAEGRRRTLARTRIECDATGPSRSWYQRVTATATGQSRSTSMATRPDVPVVVHRRRGPSFRPQCLNLGDE